MTLRKAEKARRTPNDHVLTDSMPTDKDPRGGDPSERVSGNRRPQDPAPAFQWCWPLIGTLILLWLFRTPLFGDRILVFRDAAYWHLNTLQWTVEQWQNGSVPLWNDLHGLGINWVGQGTTTVFYPGTWLLAVPVGHFSQRYTMLIVLHLLWCGWGMYRLARRMDIQPTAAWFAALTFALSGPVLSLHGNWPFLIGATWLPWAMIGLWDAIVRRRWAGICTAAAALALMVLGGEPQAALLWALAAGLLIVAHLRAHRPPIRLEEQRPGPTSRLRWSLGVVLAIGLLAAGGSCVQWWPLWASAQNSTRAVRSVPTNVYHAAALWQTGAPDWADQTTRGLLGPPEPGSQTDQALQFSQPPWHWSTLLAGNVMGTWRSVHARWDRHLPANDRVWNPTLYAGLISAILVLARSAGLLSVGWRFWRLGRNGRRRRRRTTQQLQPLKSWAEREATAAQHTSQAWLWAVLVLFGLGSCGWYGAVWLWVELQAACGIPVTTPAVGPQVGGVYWWLTLLCPGFDQFRYPAKLWIMAALAWSLLASFELNQWLLAMRAGPGSVLAHRWTHEMRRAVLVVTLLLLTLLSALGVTSSPMFINYFFRTFQQAPWDPWLGALHVPQALLELHLSLIQSLVVGGLLCGWCLAATRWAATPWAATPWSSTRSSERSSAWWGWGLVAITLVDVTVNNAWLVQTIDRRALSDSTVWDTKTSPYRAALDAEQSLAQQRFWYEPQRLHEHRFRQMSEKWGERWAWQPTEKLTWQAIYSMRATGAPQFHLALRVPSVNVEQTLDPLGPTVLREEVAHAVRALPSETGEVFWRSYLRSLGVRYWLSWENPSDVPRKPLPLKWTTLPQTPPPVWLADKWEVRPRPTTAEPLHKHSADMRAIWFSDETIADCPTTVVLDHTISLPNPWAPVTTAISPTSPTSPTSPIRPIRPNRESAGIASWTFSEREKSAIVSVDSPVVLVWRQAFDPGWQAVVRSDGGAAHWQPTVAVQRLFCGVALPPGRHEVRLVYFPAWYWVGGGITLASWCGLLGLGIRQLRRPPVRSFRMIVHDFG